MGKKPSMYRLSISLFVHFTYCAAKCSRPSENIRDLIQNKHSQYFSGEADYPDLSGMQKKGVRIMRVQFQFKTVVSHTMAQPFAAAAFACTERHAVVQG